MTDDDPDAWAARPTLDCSDGSLPEYRIADVAIARARREMPRAVFRVGDMNFDSIGRRLRLKIRHGKAPWSKRAPFMDYEIGTTTARIYAGGPHLDWKTVEVIEL